MKIKEKQKLNYINVEEISENDCNLLITDYLEYIGLSSIKQCFLNELESTRQTNLVDSLNSLNLNVSNFENLNYCMESDREKITFLIFEFKFKEALDSIIEIFPEFQEKNYLLYVKLLSLPYLKYILNDDVRSALIYAKKYFSEFVNKNYLQTTEQFKASEYLEKILLLIAFNSPLESEEAKFLNIKFRSKLAHEINVAIINYLEPLKQEPNLLKLFRSLFFTEIDDEHVIKNNY